MINEPNYGFTSSNREKLAQALEAVRRKICAYNMGYRMDQDTYCDCKYGLSIDKIVAGEYINSEQTGCPELRSIVYWLLHGDENADIVGIPGDSVGSGDILAVLLGMDMER